jgi:cytochrome c-type biogenesis protein CcmH
LVTSTRRRRVDGRDKPSHDATAIEFQMPKEGILMTLWFVLTALIAVASVSAAAPFIRRRERNRLAQERLLAFYRERLATIDRAAAPPALDASPTGAAAADQRATTPDIDPNAGSSPLSRGERALAAVGVSAIIVGGLAAFAIAGANFDGTDASQRARSDSALAQADVAMLTAVARAAPAAPATPAKTPLASVDELVQRLVARLQSNPGDVQGWRTLGWSYFNLARYDDAAAAYAKAIELAPDSAEDRDGRIESLLRAANGSVTPAARDAVEETLKRHPGDARARFVKGLALDQGGDRAAAEQTWNDLKRDLDPSDPWAKEVDKKLGAKTAEAPETAATPTNDQPPPAAADGKGPTASEVRAADAMAPADRTAMIERMVAGLADRLDKSPRDADGWAKLMRSWLVLGNADKAKDALDSALKAFADDPEQMRRLTATAEDLGLKR